MRGEQFRVMGVFRAVKVDQRRDSAARLFTGETVHQFRKKVLPTRTADQQNIVNRAG